MKNKLLISILSLFIVLRLEAQTPDLILYGGKIFTADPEQLYTEALAIKDGRILASGSSAEIQKLAGQSTKRIDLSGRVVVPGFNDAHNHLLLNDLKAYEIQFKTMNPDWKMLQDSLKKAAAQLPPGRWIVAEIGPSIANSPEVSRVALDRITLRHPVRLLSWWGHVGIFNSPGLKEMQIQDSPHDPKGGFYDRLPDGKTLAGKAFEKNAYNPNTSYDKVSAMRGEEELVGKFRGMTGEMLKLGITSYQNMCTLARAEDLARLWKKAGLPFRLRLIKWADMNPDGTIMVPGKEMPEHPEGMPLLTVSGTKWLIDGTPIEQGAFNYKPYPGRNDWYGRMNYSKEEIEKACREALSRKDQLMFHVSGEQSYGNLLDILEKIDMDWKALRPRIEHGDMAGYSQDFLDRTKKLGIIIVQNPTHFTSLDGAVSAPQYANAMKTLLKNAIPLAIGSDGPFNPFLNIMLAATHPMRPSEALSVEEAVIAYTNTAAFAEFEEKNKGTLTKGKVADLAVLSQDIFKVPLPALMATQSVLTLVDGQVVYDAGVLK